jgi:putative glutamine amidotransferase
MTTPLIGVTTFHTLSPSKQYRYISVTETYIRALVKAGAAPVLIPLQLPEDRLDNLIGRLDGILFTGGGDLAPSRYDGRDHPRLDDVDPERDRVEFHVAGRAFDARLPFLGICRGLQTINVARGGTLYVDIQDERPGSLRHDQFETAPRAHLAHAVQVGEDSLLSRISGQPIFGTNSGHHQAIRDLGDGLLATAYAEDGVIEAIELPDHPFGLAVQWHPEWLTHLPHHYAIIQSFVRAADGDGKG